MEIVKVTGTSQTYSFAKTPSKDLYAELEKEIRAYFDNPSRLDNVLDYFGTLLDAKAPYQVFLMAGSMAGVHGIFVKGLIRMAWNKRKAV